MSQPRPLIVVEGVDGVGKTSVAKQLADKLGFAYFKTPSKTFEAVRAFFDHEQRPPLSRFSFYLATLIEDTNLIRSMLRSQGVVCDRYTLSLQFYHEELSGVPLSGVMEAFDWLPPAACIILHATPETLHFRIAQRGRVSDQRLETDTEFLARVNHRYLGCDGFHIDTDNLQTADTVQMCVERLSGGVLQAAQSPLVLGSVSRGPDKQEQALTERFALRQARVVDYHDDYKILKTRLGRAAAVLFEQETMQEDKCKVGIGGGSTLLAMVDSLPARQRSIDIYNLSFMGRGPEIDYVGSDFLANLLLQKSGSAARAFVADLPPLPSRSDLALTFVERMLAEIREIPQLIRRASDVDVAFVGAGAMIPTGDMRSELMKLGIRLKDLAKAGAIGGINYNWIDHEGRQVDTHWLAVSAQSLRSMVRRGRMVNLVAGGNHKVPVIEAILRAKLANVLITDRNTVQSLLT